MVIPLSRPDITAADRRAVLDVMKTPFLSLGPTGPKFEKEFAEYLGVRHAVAVSSGTCGLHLCVRALGMGKGDEVVTTPYSFIASANCVMFDGARPRFVDIDPKSWNIDATRIASAVNSRTKALLPVHVFGLPCDMEEVLHVAKKKHLPVIEDACEALGAEYRGRRAGTMGTCAVFGFYPNKQMTTGEGGMVVTNDSRLAEKVASMRNQGSFPTSGSATTTAWTT
jgi:perosamine synthetase